MSFPTARALEQYGCVHRDYFLHELRKLERGCLDVRSTENTKYNSYIQVEDKLVKYILDGLLDKLKYLVETTEAFVFKAIIRDRLDVLAHPANKDLELCPLRAYIETLYLGIRDN